MLNGLAVLACAFACCGGRSINSQFGFDAAPPPSNTACLQFSGWTSAGPGGQVAAVGGDTVTLTISTGVCKTGIAVNIGTIPATNVTCVDPTHVSFTVPSANLPWPGSTCGPYGTWPSSPNASTCPIGWGVDTYTSPAIASGREYPIQQPINVINGDGGTSTSAYPLNYRWDLSYDNGFAICGYRCQDAIWSGSNLSSWPPVYGANPINGNTYCPTLTQGSFTNPPTKTTNFDATTGVCGVHFGTNSGATGPNFSSPLATPYQMFMIAGNLPSDGVKHNWCDGTSASNVANWYYLTSNEFQTTDNVHIVNQSAYLAWPVGQTGSILTEWNYGGAGLTYDVHPWGTGSRALNGNAGTSPLNGLTLGNRYAGSGINQPTLGDIEEFWLVGPFVNGTWTGLNNAATYKSWHTPNAN